ncbi:MAG: HEPN domain-containing protein [Defluviitaleaceae bacterium]|nr:HEPN domain-containing protein [Defluviitaleaceae bacterium]MCL2276167.1 HEPN domain-containing protein [Defluviitaleaceae bacterium]
MEHAKDMSKYRYEQALQCLQSSKALISLDDYKGAANRSYYGVFHAMRSVMALSNVDFGNHGQVIGYFRKSYIKTEIFPKEMSRIIDTLFKERNKCDYDDFYVINKEDVTNQLSSAEYFISEINKYLVNFQSENEAKGK